VKGRTFIVPAVDCFASDGTLSPGAITAALAAGAGLIAAAGAEFAVWKRVYNDATPPVQVGGAIAPVQAVTVKDMASQLRSRRL